ncbi:MAG: right-handed parallel beta-helix repeat-containing protein [Bacteroidales bacterium]|nr:right-handed parallel beta-helix repeat-containing protein [Bacteroidales bacterium]
MNKILTASAIALLIGGAACSNEEMVNPSNGGDGNVSFSVTIPAKSFSTRAFGDGLNANKLEYAVYDKDANNAPVSNGETKFSETSEGSLTTTVNINLANGRNYNIVFFASPESGDVYTLNTATGEVTVDYSQMTVYNSSDYDCFSTVYNTGKVTGPINDEVTLYRPVAQVNWGTSDLNDGTVNGTNGVYGDGAANLYTAVSVKGVNNVLNILTGQRSNADGFEGTVTFSSAARPSGETFPVEPATYQYLSMQYLLVPEESSVVDLELTAYAGEESKSTVTVTNAPVQANYRTNIYGALLTNPANLNINKDPIFNDPSYDINSTDLSKGGNMTVREDVANIDIPAELDAPLVLNLAAKVDKLTLPASNAKAITVRVLKDVEFPEFVFTENSTIKDFTLLGDPNSEKTFEGFVFHAHSSGKPEVTNTVRPAMLENLTVDGVHFDGGAIIPQFTVSTKNLVVKNCVFSNLVSPAVAIQHFAGGGNQTAEGITIENCTLDFAEDAPSNTNGLYLLDITGDITVKGNTITGAPYHGISISAGTDNTRASKIDVSGNIINGCKEDGVKIDKETSAAISITNNNINVVKNSIRVKNSLDGNSATITGNILDMKNAAEWNGNDLEPSAILLINDTENENPVTLKVEDNTFNNCPENQQISKKNIKDKE